MRHEIEKWILFIINCFIAFLWFGIIIFPIFFLEELRVNDFNLTLDFIVTALALFASLFLIRYPLVQFKKILHALSERELFTTENIRCFKKISYPLFIFALGSLFIPTSSVTLTLIFITIKCDTFVYLIMAMAALLMSYILDEARKIQQEADELKQENQLTI